MIAAGCLSKPAPPSASSDAAGDPDGNSGPACINPAVKDDFDDTFKPPCGAGFEDGDGSSTISRDTGSLRQTPATNKVSAASCSWQMLFDEGAFVEVRKTLDTGGSFTILQVSNGDLSVGIQVLDETAPILMMFDTVRSESIAELPYKKNQMRWWRLRPEAGLVIGEYSANGRAWTQLGASITPAPTTAMLVSLNAGVYRELAKPGVAEFNVCP
jgi:hypothetical protein